MVKTNGIGRNSLSENKLPDSCCPGSLSTPWPAWRGKGETNETHHQYKLYVVSFILFLFFSNFRVSAHRGRIRTVRLPHTGQRGTIQVYRRSRPVRRVHRLSERRRRRQKELFLLQNSKRSQITYTHTHTNIHTSIYDS